MMTVMMAIIYIGVGILIALGVACLVLSIMLLIKMFQS